MEEVAFACLSSLIDSFSPSSLSLVFSCSSYLPQVAAALASSCSSSSWGLGMPIWPLVFWTMMNHPQSLLARYFLNCLWATLISSLWSNFFLYTRPRILLRTSPWMRRTHLMTSLSRSSSRPPREPARKNTRVCPSLYLSRSKGMPSMRAVTATLLSEEDLRAACPRQAYLSLNSGYIILLGKPRMQILIPSSTPLQVSWCMIRGGSTSPGFLWVLGTRQRTKWGSQE